MTEAKVCTDLRAALLRLLPGARVYKHHDVSTAGIPDLSINWNQRTMWVEVKLLKLGETESRFRKHFNALQLAEAVLLDQQQSTYYFVAYPYNAKLRATIWNPDALRFFLTGKDIEWLGYSRPYKPRGYAFDGLFDQAAERIASWMRK